jgi:hypothetical protein
MQTVLKQNVKITFHIVGEQQIHEGVQGDCAVCKKKPARLFDLLLEASKRSTATAMQKMYEDPKGSAALLNAATGTWETLQRLAPGMLASAEAGR